MRICVLDLVVSVASELMDLLVFITAISLFGCFVSGKKVIKGFFRINPKSLLRLENA